MQKNIKGTHYDDIASIYEAIKTNHKGSTILIKGSRMMGLNELVDILVNTANSP
jgi:UDP-N-acetylmuramoyl-tripeptide--D-alanyl-D-alanine ligase